MRVERRAGLMIAQAMAEIIYSSIMLETARSAIVASRQTQKAVPISVANHINTSQQGPMTTVEPDIKRIVDSTAKHFAEHMQYSDILADSPSLSEMRKLSDLLH